MAQATATKERTDEARSWESEAIADRDTARSQVYALIRESKLPDDGAKVLLDAADFTPEDVAEAVEVVKRRDALQSAVGQRDPAGARLHEARKKLRTHEAKVEEMKATGETLAAALQSPLAAMRTAEKAEADLEVLEFVHADLLGIARPDDLDQCTLVGGGEEVGVSDPDAPRQRVPQDVLHEQKTRRCAIMRAAIAAAHKANNEAFAEWHKGDIRNAGSGWHNPNPAPTKIVPTWHAIAKLPAGERDRLERAGAAA